MRRRHLLKNHKSQYIRFFQKNWIFFVFASITSVFFSHIRFLENLIYLVLALSFLIFGIGHGGVDGKLIETLEPETKLKFYLHYLLKIFSFLIFWYLFPKIALLFFLFQSANHFGESECNQREYPSPSFKELLNTIWGMGILGVEILGHPEQSVPILEVFCRENLSPITHWGALHPTAIFSFTVSLGTAAVLVSFLNSPRAAWRTLYLVIFLGTTPLIPGFFAYFSLWHAQDAIQMQRNGLRRHGLKLSFIEYLKLAAPFTFLAGVFLGSLVFIEIKSGNNSLHQNSLAPFWAYVFAGIGGLTAAHATIMKKFLKNTMWQHHH